MSLNRRSFLQVRKRGLRPPLRRFHLVSALGADSRAASGPNDQINVLR